MTKNGQAHELNGAGYRKRVSVLGATGTIGDSTCDLLAQNPDRFEVVALSANRNAKKLASLAVQFKAKFAAIADENAGAELRGLLAGTGIECGAGKSAVVDAGARDADVVMASIVGYAGLAPTLAALKQGRTVALANKECLVCAGAYFMNERERYGTTLLPVDSEHSAVFQSLDEQEGRYVEKIVLTASGGPFRTWTKEQIAAARVEDALKHPNWTMGQKITIDSATLMNKGLEIIEAFHLFKVRADQLDAVVHPQSIIHALVYYTDGSVIAQASVPDMRTPIALSLAWPERLKAETIKRLDLAEAATLTFEKPDETRFPALRLAKEVLKSGGNTPTVLNAANEVAVEAFLNRQISFPGIAEAVERTLDMATSALAGVLPDSLDAVTHIDERARDIAKSALSSARPAVTIAEAAAPHI
ncbi:1-deoxy-D-xylulose-5-phosphate reductoisomerase [Rhodomicrobium vannielii ATCC 17100]|uniref:1-deoxy-D-xylulose-5-phosphate reductoisomerase n=1 Tax=Rhodomicrobium vannielii TaxID=1069 RepID=UPI00191A7E6E|nr:1-deoxy-D-xylulose-5-phosphate reductoisomerase [Rhodomicrobium vannielii]MBJ7534900.1 1-deoxy-D-xylulose-5-phosphate reductoisomerase [Rhodomicrobium vannielii ATCC 17100]